MKVKELTDALKEANPEAVIKFETGYFSPSLTILSVYTANGSDINKKDGILHIDLGEE